MVRKQRDGNAVSYTHLDMEKKIGWKQFLEGRLNEEEGRKYLELLPEITGTLTVAMMKLEPESLQRTGMTELLCYICLLYTSRGADPPRHGIYGAG